MDFEGKVIQFLGETNGTSKSGNPWKKKEWIVETFGQYPKKVKIQCMNARADALNLEPGKDYIISIDLESREFNGKWYTDANVFRAQETQVNQNIVGPQTSYSGGFQNPQTQQGFTNPPYPTSEYGGNNQSFASNEGDSDEDLPF